MGDRPRGTRRAPAPGHAGRLASPQIDTRGLLPLLLTLPLIPALAVSLARGRADQVLAEVLVIACFGAGAHLIYGAIRRERRLGTSAGAERWAGILALAGGTVACNTLLVGHTPAFAAVTAGLVVLGGWLAYAPAGERTRPEHGFTPALRQHLDEARTRIIALEEAAAALGRPALQEHVERIATRARRILSLLAEDPRHVIAARRFLHVYLDGALRVTRQYERTAIQHGVTTLEPRFATVLQAIEDRFAEQYERLLADDLLDLDVQIEVLQARLQNEGIP